MRSDTFDHVRPAGDAPHNRPGGVAVDSVPITFGEDRPVETVADGQVACSGDPRSERHHGDLAALAEHRKASMPALERDRQGRWLQQQTVAKPSGSPQLPDWCSSACSTGRVRCRCSGARPAGVPPVSFHRVRPQARY